MKHRWIKTLYETWIKINDVNGVCFFYHPYLITLMAYLCSQRPPNVQIKYVMFDWSIYRLFVLNMVRKLDSFQMNVFVYCSSTWSMLQLKTCFEASITRNDAYGVSLIHLSYLITLLAYLCSQWTLNAQINYFMLDWSIYTLFVLNRGCKHDSLQIFIFVYVCSTWSIFEHKTRFEMWITRNDENGVSFFNLLYLIKLMACLCSQRSPNFLIKSFMLDWSI
jgi:hypothetical protein